MLEVSTLRKNKVNLADYNNQQDMDNRMLMADMSTFDLEVLEEILFSPLKISIKKLVRGLGCEEDALSPSLQKLARTGLFSIQEDSLIVDKDLRKYFEFQIVRFDSDFKPDMEFLSALLRKVPIHFLPAWYSIPRTSNNIFESIVEKYLLTPQIFQRYLVDLNFTDPRIHGIVSDLFSAPDFKLFSSDIIAKYNLERRDFEEIMLLLEFNFIGCISYQKEDDHWIEVLTPFYEWHQYLRFMKNTDAPRIGPGFKIAKTLETDLGFIEDMSSLLAAIAKKPLSIDWEIGTPLSKKAAADLATHCSIKDERYLASIASKLLLLELAVINKEKLAATPTSASWLAMSLENRALHLYRSPKNRILNTSLPAQIATERNIRESEKSLKRVLHGNWVFFDDFVQGVLVTLSEHSVVMLKRTGKHWKYSLPIYSESEKSLLKAVIFEWLFEAGMVATGTCSGRDCFAVTPFGRFFFEE